MKVIIAGSRKLGMPHLLAALRAVPSDFEITEIISGGASGIDKAGEEFAQEHKIPLKIFYAEWNKYGKSAGYKRNTQMADYAEALIAVWDGSSRGTKHMIDIATSKGLKVFVYNANS